MHQIFEQHSRRQVPVDAARDVMHLRKVVDQQFFALSFVEKFDGSASLSGRDYGRCDRRRWRNFHYGRNRRSGPCECRAILPGAPACLRGRVTTQFVLLDRELEQRRLPT